MNLKHKFYRMLCYFIVIIFSLSFYQTAFAANSKYIQIAAAALEAHNKGEDYIYDYDFSNTDMYTMQAYCNTVIPYYFTFIRSNENSGAVKYIIHYQTYMDYYYRDYAKTAIRDIVSKNISTNMSDEKKVRILHDWVANNNKFASEWESDDKFSGVSVFYCNQSVCAGYARAFKMLCDAVNIPCLYVSGHVSEELHAWNLVYVNNSWYQVDVTHDDVGDTIRYNNFLIPLNGDFGDHIYDGISLNEYISLGNYIYLRQASSGDVLPSQQPSQPSKPEDSRKSNKSPIIKQHPRSKTVRTGATASVSVEAVSADKRGSLFYQWYSSTGESQSNWKKIDGATDPLYIVPTGLPSKVQYYCVITDVGLYEGYGFVAQSASAAATITVSKNALTDNDAIRPEILAQPKASAIKLGESAVLSVTAKSKDNGVLSYQWFYSYYDNPSKNPEGWKPIKGAVAPTLTISTKNTSNTAKIGKTYFFCGITNTNRSVSGAETAFETSVYVPVIVT